MDPDIAEEVRRQVFRHHLTIGEFFEEAARRESRRLAKLTPKEFNGLRAGRPMRRPRR